MMRSEFIEITGAEVTMEEYSTIETVYMFYPSILDKQQLGELYKNFGMTIINDMFPRAKELQDIEELESTLKLEYRKKMDGIAERRAAANK